MIAAPQNDFEIKPHLAAAPPQHMKLIGSLASPFTRKVRVVLAEKKIEYEFEIDNPWDAATGVPARNPLGKVPVLVLDDGTTLFDSRVIVEFLDNASPLSRLLPSGNRERIEVRRWEALADGVIDAAVLVRMEHRRKPAQRSPEWIERQMGKVRAGLAAMDADLGDKPWCAGSVYTIADIAVGVCLAWLDFRFPDLDWRKDHANLARALAKLSERPSFAETVPGE
jgi:glutathione S-transferase